MGCPCCGGTHLRKLDTPSAHQRCATCGHRWHAADQVERTSYYENLEHRNAHLDERKLEERVADLLPLIPAGARVLEVGCADGQLGARLKAKRDVYYAGIELSRDATAAAAVLDRVERRPAAEIAGDPYDFVLGFHVLEHIVDVSGELGEWRRLLGKSGVLVVEVPNQAGHPLLEHDQNAEHVHQFTALSLAALLARCGLALERLSAGHYESPVYSDSLRAVARLALEPAERRSRLLARFRARLPGPFAVQGLGGDFRNYVLPLLDELPVAALLDSDERRHGERVGKLVVSRFDPARHAGLPVLVASPRLHAEIAASLAAAGVPPALIVGLDEIYDGK
jgi:SAM-dependent methyltransferase